MKDITSVILFQIDKTSKVAKQYSQAEFDKLNLGITVDQWVLLKIIEESTELSQKELADKSSRDPASITRTLDILGKKQLTERMAIPNNRRKYTIQLTQIGLDFIEKNKNIITQLRDKSLEGFTIQEQNLLHKMLLKIQKNMT